MNKESITLKNWCNTQENIGVALRKEHWKMQIGLSYSKKKIGTLEKQSKTHGETFLKHWKKPEELYQEAVGSIASEKTYKLELKLEELRRTLITSKVSGKIINWPTWRQFAVTAKDKERKKVFDEFMRKSKIIAPVIHEKFDKETQIFAEYGLEPLSMYLKDHHMSLSALKKTIQTLSSAIKKPFLRQWQDYSQELFGREPEYYDDLYVLRNKIYSSIEPIKQKPLAVVQEIITTQGFGKKNISEDSADRPRKYPSPFCSFIKIPSDIRVSYKAEGSINDMTSVLHEYGHAIHASNIRSELPYWVRYKLNEGLAESFSTLYEDLMHNHEFLTEYLKLSHATAHDLIKRIRFIRMFAIEFYAANSLFKIDYWKKRLTPEQCDANYAKHIKKCMGIDLPGEYWKLHHILPEEMMYVPSYLLAMIRAAEIGREFTDKYSAWWTSTGAGEHLRKLMQDGSESPVANFSKPKTHVLIEDLKEK